MLGPVEVAFRIVDVFAPRPFGGNPLCVVPDAAALPAASMQALAAEIGFSESTFVTAASRTRYDVRIFMPDREIPFAGHPTLGTAYVLASLGRIAASATQVVAAGEVPVEVDVAAGTAAMTQPPTAFGAEVADRAAIAASLGLPASALHPTLPPQVVSTGHPPLLVPLVDVAAVAAIVPDARHVEPTCRASGAEELYAFALADRDAASTVVEARYVGFGAVAEDAATGSAAGPLGAYLAARGVGTRVLVRQGAHLGRPSELRVDADDPDRVRVAGAVRPVGEGVFHL